MDYTQNALRVKELRDALRIRLIELGFVDTPDATLELMVTAMQQVVDLGAPSAVIVTLDDVAIAKGLYSAAGKASIATAEKAKIVPGNIRSGADILGVTGNFTGEPIPPAHGIVYNTISVVSNPLEVTFCGTVVPTSCFENEYTITGVTFKDAVTSILTRGFSGCANLANAALPDTITSIGNNAFYNDSKLALTKLPDALTGVGTQAFYGCSAMVLTSLPANLRGVPDWCFAMCTKMALTDLGTINSIGQSAFTGTACNFTEIRASGLMSRAFTGLSKLVHTAFLGPSLPAYCFENCTNLLKVWISNACNAISAYGADSGPFKGCPANLIIYCEAASKPVGWSPYWNYINATTTVTVVWGVTREQFNSVF